MNNKNRGMTFIEITIVIAIAALFMAGVFKFFRNTYDVWLDTTNSVAAGGDARTASNEMVKYIRQASSATITIGASDDSIKFEIAKTTTDWHTDLTVHYFQDGSTLKRLMKDSTTTIISDGVDFFYVWHDSGSASSYACVGTSLTVIQGDKSVNLDKRVMIRSGR
ncbi:MAG: prepilin-type N-terminal cleavage/methylation domain-containing protein [Elusimicrobiota bacterium]